MQFVVIGHDGTDEEAQARRQAVRHLHIELGEQLAEQGKMWYGAALLDDNGNMIGSMLVMNFVDQDALDEWLDVEPYVTGDVWRKIAIHRCNIRDPWQYSKPKEYFESHA